VQSVDYDVGLDFWLNLPKVDVESVDDNSTDSNITGPKKLFTLLAERPVSYGDDCLIVLNKSAAGSAVHRSVKMPSVDRSTKPTSSSSATTLPSSSAVLNNTVSDTASDSGPSVASVAHIDNILKSTNKVDDVTEMPSSGKSRSSTKSDVPPAPDRSMKPAAPVTDTVAELNMFHAKKMQEANAVANLMRENRKLEMEMEKKRKQLADTEFVSE